MAEPLPQQPADDLADRGRLVCRLRVRGHPNAEAGQVVRPVELEGQRAADEARDRVEESDSSGGLGSLALDNVPAEGRRSPCFRLFSFDVRSRFMYSGIVQLTHQFT